MWEELVEECRQLLNGVVLQSDISDRWLWESNTDDVYTVRGAYQILTTVSDPPIVGVCNTPFSQYTNFLNHLLE